MQPPPQLGPIDNNPIFQINIEDLPPIPMYRPATDADSIRYYQWEQVQEHKRLLKAVGLATTSSASGGTPVYNSPSYPSSIGPDTQTPYQRYIGQQTMIWRDKSLPIGKRIDAT